MNRNQKLMRRSPRRARERISLDISQNAGGALPAPPTAHHRVKIARARLESAKITAAAATTDGPAGASQVQAPASPDSTEVTPTMEASAAIPSGERAKGRLAAAGMTRTAALSSAPTILTAPAPPTA